MKFSSALKLVVAATIALTISSYNLYAAESGALNYLAGAPGSYVQKFPPIPGIFLLSQTSFTTSRGLFDENGDEVGDYNMDLWCETFRLLSSYPGNFLGANVYSQLILPIITVDQSYSLTTPYYSLDLQDSKSGISNITISPVILNWLKGNSSYMLGLDFTFKGLNYDKDDFANVSTGYSSIVPTFGYRYDDPSGIDIALKVAFLFNQENSDTNYKTGDLLALDFFGGWNFGKWKVGVAGGYTQQLENDIINGDETSGHKVRSLNLGPSVTLTGLPFSFEVNYQRGLIAENTTKNDTLWFNVSMPLYVPGRH